METQDERLSLIARLNSLLEREYNSLVQYLLECDPWIPIEYRDRILQTLKDISQESRDSAEALVGVITALQGSPVLGNFSHDIVDLSYLAIDYSLEKAVDWKDQLIELYDEVIRDYGDWEEVERTLPQLRTHVLSQKRRLNETLELLKSPSEIPPESTD